ncbi:hypothetical protein SRABI96_05046 [Peribacillus sp. Bi96]|nr:hypothetical protein SRABI96_05046 [Peribacillus sp. Bi96]
MELEPQCPTLLFFPEEEQSFNVDELISMLKVKNFDLHKFNGKHGFSDPYTLKYKVESAQRAFSTMMNFFTKQ